MHEDDFRMMKTRMKCSGSSLREQGFKVASSMNDAQHHDFTFVNLVEDQVLGESGD